MLEDFSQPSEGPNWTDRIEWWVDRAIRGVAMLFMPWKWFQKPTGDGRYYARPGGGGIFRRVQYAVYFVVDTLAISCSRCLDWLEYSTATLFQHVAEALSLRRPMDPSEFDDDDQ